MQGPAENVTYFGAAANDHGIAYSREAFRHMSRLCMADRKKITSALIAMRTDDQLDEQLTETRLVRRFPQGLRFVFERSGSALTVLAITGSTNPARDIKDTHS